MESVLDWGLRFIEAVQQFRTPWLDAFFQAITFMGEEQFYLLFLVLIMWCVDYRLGARLAIAFVLSAYLNGVLKNGFNQPRPAALNPAVELSHASGGGLPSGHAQNGILVWGAMAYWVRRRWLTIVAVLIIVLLGFSRVYLGAHFPTDVLGGWLIGAVLLVVYVRAAPAVERLLVPLSLAIQVLIALGIPILLAAVTQDNDATSAMGTLAGLGMGAAVKHRLLPFDAGGPWWQRVVRFLVGVAGLLAIYVGLRLVLPGEAAPLYQVFRFARYWLLGLWGAAGAIWVFRVARLTSTTAAAPRA